MAVSTGGALTATLGDAVSPQYGDLMAQDQGYTEYTQPGGRGTAVLPAMPIGEITGEFIAGCGHSFRSWDVLIQSYGPCGVPTAYVRCPLCKYLQKVLWPASALYSEANAILIA